MQPNNSPDQPEDTGAYTDPYAQLPNSSQELPPVQQQPYPEQQIPDVPPQPYQYPEAPTPLPPLEELPPEEHPFIAPTLDNATENSNSFRWWLIRRIAIVLVILGLLIGGGVGIYRAVNNSGNTDAPISEEESQELYEGDGSDISETKDPTREFRCPDGYVNSLEDEATCEKTAKSTVALIKKYSCPDGYDKYESGEKTKCQKVTGATSRQTAAATKSYSCPSGYARSSSSCSKVSTQAAKLTFSCPSGYKKSGSGSGTRCSKTTTLSATVVAKCASGYAPSGSGASTKCTKTINASTGCPSGYAKIGSGSTLRCRKTLPLGNGGGCPGGYQKLNGKCIRDVPVTYSCPGGYTKSGTKCLLGGTVSYSCPSGYARSGSGTATKCTKIVVKYTSASVKKTCPSGYSLSGSTCRKTTVIKATVSYSCPSGYSYTGGTCVRYIGGTVTSKAPIVKSSCPEGYSKSADGTKCEQASDETVEAELIQTCEEGWELLENGETGSKCVLKKTDTSSDL